ncbi:hypothetical protein ACFUTX_00090 [Microbacterium sp. NPDC057407]|uniref:hypothetical protein n=1 Tax=Microbacterium sp. NPDC057407 TaxID=3346120 RepID=UPI00366B33BF
MSILDRLTQLASHALGQAPTSTNVTPRGGRPTVKGVVASVIGAPQPTGTTSAAPANRAAPLNPPARGAEARTDVPGLTPPPAPEPTHRAALGRYTYLLQTATPTQLKRIHTEAFTRLDPADRRRLQTQLTLELPPDQRPRTSDPADLAQACGRAQVARPGILARILTRTPGTTTTATGRSPAVGTAAAAGGLLTAVASSAILTTAAAPLLADALTAGVDFSALADTITVPDLGVDQLTTGVEDLAGEATGASAGAAEQLTGWEERIAGLHSELSSLEFPGFGGVLSK